MKTIKGPGIFLAQFADDQSPFNSLEGLAHWAAQLGFAGVQIPSWDHRLFDLKAAVESQGYCDDILGILHKAGVQLTELSTHLQGQLVASHSSYDVLLEGFAPAGFEGNPHARQEWAVQQLQWAAEASRRMGLTAHATFSGALAWPFFYPWPQRPAGLIDEAFRELGNRWRPILDVFDEAGVDLCFELHPGEDLHDGATFDRFLSVVDDHPRANILYDPSHMVLQQMDYLAFLDLYHERVRAFHVKDAEFHPTGRSGVYGGYQDWLDRPGRFRSLGDGQVDFGAIFSKLAQYDYPGWAVLEWECCLKHPKTGAAEGAIFIRDHIIPVTDRAFDDFAGGKADQETNRKILGIEAAEKPICAPDDRLAHKAEVKAES
ncbi:MAG TPA: sugar phosphate isomerase/epimerase family protein [Terracidiphilus sp.]|nr:sugar phosphate isomerase/epimerase family protein [Terracidiphilus sp.]